MRRYTFSTFTPGEVEKITGLTTVQQRDWRRRGFLPANAGGHARFEASVVAELWTMQLLADRDVGPQYSREIARFGGAGILAGAFELKEAFEGDHLRALEWNAKHVELHWRNQSEWLTQRIFRELLDLRFKPARYLLWLPDGRELWCSSLEEAEADLSEGAVILLDQTALGHAFVRRAGRPLVHVEFDSAEDGS